MTFHFISRQDPKIGNSKKKKLSFFPSKTRIVTSFDIFVVTYRVTNFLPKLINMPSFSMQKKTEFLFFEFTYFRILPIPQADIQKNCGEGNDGSVSGSGASDTESNASWSPGCCGSL